MNSYVFLRQVVSILLSFPCLSCTSSGQYSNSEDACFLAIRSSIEGANLPHGISPLPQIPETYSWSRRGRPGTVEPLSNFSHFVPWGQVFTSIPDGNAAATPLVELAPLVTLRCVDNQWSAIVSRQLRGRDFVPGFKENLSSGATFRPTVGGAYSLDPNPNAIFHFWPDESRYSIGGGVSCGWLVLGSARVVGPHSQNGPTMLFGVGIDFWKGKDSSWSAFANSSDGGIGRVSIIGSNWTTHIMPSSDYTALQSLRAQLLTSSILREALADLPSLSAECSAESPNGVQIDHKAN